MPEIYRADLGGTIVVPNEKRPRTQSYVVFHVGSALEAVTVKPETTDMQIRRMVDHNNGVWDGSRVSAGNADEAIEAYRMSA